MDNGEQTLGDVMDEATDMYANAAVEEALPSVREVLASWPMPKEEGETGARRARLMTVPDLAAFVPALSVAGVQEGFAEMAEHAGSPDWRYVRTDTGHTIEPNGSTLTDEEVETSRLEAVKAVVCGCMHALVRALASSLDEEGHLVGALDDTMVPDTPTAREAFDRYLTQGDGSILVREFVLQALRAVKRALPEGQELPKALAEGFPRRGQEEADESV